MLTAPGGTPSARQSRRSHAAPTRRDVDSPRRDVLRRSVVPGLPHGQVRARRHRALRIPPLDSRRARPLLGGIAASLHGAAQRDAAGPDAARRHGGCGTHHRRLLAHRFVLLHRRRRLFSRGLRRRVHPPHHGAAVTRPGRYRPLEAGPDSRPRQPGGDPLDVPGRAGHDHAGPHRRRVGADRQPPRGSGGRGNAIDSVGVGLGPAVRRQRPARLLRDPEGPMGVRLAASG